MAKGIMATMNFMAAQQEMYRKYYEDIIPWQIMTYGPLGTFLRTSRKTSDGRTVLRPSDGTARMMDMLGGIVEDGDKLSLEHLYGERLDLYTAYPFDALHTMRAMFGEELNMSILDIGAEMLVGVGTSEPLHTLQLYEIVDSEYRMNYVLSTSSCVLEVKSNELHNAQEIDYEETMFQKDSYRITRKGLCEFICALAQDHFGRSLNLGDLDKVSDILLLASDTTDFVASSADGNAQFFEEIENYRENIRFGMLVSTNVEYDPENNRNQDWEF